MWPRSRPMSGTTQAIALITLLLAIILPTLAILLYDNKGLAQMLFAAIIIAGGGLVAVRWSRRL